MIIPKRKHALGRKATYYCESRNPDFDNRKHNVLLVYKQLELQLDEEGNLVIN